MPMQKLAAWAATGETTKTNGMYPAITANASRHSPA